MFKIGDEVLLKNSNYSFNGSEGVIVVIYSHDLVGVQVKEYRNTLCNYPLNKIWTVWIKELELLTPRSIEEWL